MEKQMEIEEKIDYRFKRPELLEDALTHRSYSNEKHTGRNYERLELLGDSVVQLVVTGYFFNHFPDMEEGELTKKRAAIVCEKSLAAKARELGLGAYARLGKGETMHGGSDREGLLCDLMEAVAGAIYQDGGFFNAEQFIMRFILNNTEGEPIEDYKSRLQEYYGKRADDLEYRVISTVQNEDNSMLFTVELSEAYRTEGIVSYKRLSRGIGKSKKAAEQQAAKEALKILLAR